MIGSAISQGIEEISKQSSNNIESDRERLERLRESRLTEEERDEFEELELEVEERKRRIRDRISRYSINI